MVTVGIVAAALLGMRHGIDPDHLAAIDNLTRNAVETRPRASSYTGALFAGGHSVMVLLIAVFVGFLGTGFVAQRTQLEVAGTWLSVAILFAMAAWNVRLLLSGRRPAGGLRARLFSRLFSKSTSPLVAIPIGFLFGLGFETSSQVAAYAVAVSGGVAGALLIGCAFCGGMIAVDTVDSLLVNRVVRASDPRACSRAWLWTVTAVALGVALYETGQLLGLHVPIGDGGVAVAVIATVLAVFALLAVRSLRHAPLRKEAPASR
jgi:nickel/cobalt transporter (NiCoT) family protein